MARVVEAGTELAGYRVLRQLGRGGAGLVYEVEHLRLGRKAALKLLSPGLSRDESFQSRFVQESRLVAAIDHPNIVPIYDAGEVDDILYLAMRLVSGGDLGMRIAQEPPLAVERAVEVVEQVAAALDAAHARDIVHRDVKPANILFDGPTDRVYLMDFGIAKSQTPGHETREGLFVGTVGYAAPEQIESREVSPSTDVYALGCVLYECLAGQPPFARPTDVAVVFAHIRDEPPQLTGRRPDLPPAIDEAIVTALAKSPSDRFRSAGELAAAARRALRLSPATSVAAAWAPPPTAVSPRPEREPERARLPVAATPLVGRGSELAAAEALLVEQGARLLSLTGPGGTGKTRLGLELARAVAPRYPGGVYFVGLDAVGDAGLILAAIAEAVGDAEANVESLAARLAGAPVLLVLDNFEHVLPAAPLVADLLAGASALTVLVTSRAALRVRGEQELPVLPLALPDEAERSPTELAASPAVSLFVERARAVRPDFAVDDANAGSIAEVCIRLDGLPLAIELAAARVKVLSVEAILARLDSRLALLTSGARDLPPRHQTIRSTIDWSYELLEPVAQTLLARLAVFQGGCTVEAAEAICTAPGDLGPEAVLEGMSALVDGSLLSRRDGGAGRFELLKTIQEFALYHLLERGEVDALRAAHARHFLALAESAGPELVGADQARWVGLLADETGNLRAAMGWSLDSGELDVGLRIAGALPRFWSVRGLMSEGRVWLDRALASEPGDLPVRAGALFAAGYAALGQGDYGEAGARFEESLLAAREAGDVPREAACLAQLGWLLAACGSLDRAEEVSRQSLALAAALGATGTVALARANLADVAARHGNVGQAVTLLEESLEDRRRLGDERNVASTLLDLARAQLLLDRPEAATRLVDEAQGLALTVGDTWSLARASATRGCVELCRGEPGEARRSFASALATSWRRGDMRATAESLLGLATVAATQDDRARAAQLEGAASALRDALGASASPTERMLEERYLETLRGALGAESYAREHDSGRRLTPEEAVALAAGSQP